MKNYCVLASGICVFNGPCLECPVFSDSNNKNDEDNKPVKKDMVNHPAHYKTKKGLEAIDVIEAFTEGLNGIEATDTGNIIKYACRWKKKNGIEDLKKIRWYVNHLINYLESK